MKLYEAQANLLRGHLAEYNLFTGDFLQYRNLLS